MQFRTDFYSNHSQFADPGGTSFASAGFVNIEAAQAAARAKPRLLASCTQT